MVSQKYRKDIDGLRALAVIPVVLFHLGFELFSGGYIGVDIFFVISGYLITNIIYSEVENGRFTFSGFYERRARRILPAYFTVATLVMCFGWFYLLPLEFKWAAQGFLASVFFVSNIYFWRNSGYFSLEAEYSPFLHTWSLSVEEQFYLFFPIVVMVMYRLVGKKGVILSSVVLLVMSLLLSEFGKILSQSASFYLIFTRAWELIVGALIALGSQTLNKHLINDSMCRLLSMLGFLLILLPIFLFDSSTSFPGFAALLPVCGAAALIVSGVSKGFGYRVLSLRPMVWIGTISYSLYLWHWPVIVYGRHFFGDEITILEKIFLLVLSIVLAHVTTNTVELYFRSKRIARGGRAMWFYSLLAILLSALICGAVISMNGVPSRYSNEVVDVAEGVNDYSSRREGCHIKKMYTMSYEDKCIFGEKNALPTYAFWGDSHAMEISHAMGKVASANNRSGIHISYSSCPPAQNFSWRSRPYCDEHNTDVLKNILDDERIGTVFLVARYNSYNKNKIMQDAMLSGFEETIKALSSRGKRVVIIEPFPRYHGIVPIESARGIARGYEDFSPKITYEKYLSDNSDIFPWLDLIYGRYEVAVFKPQQYFCDQNFCEFYKHGINMLFDDDHLSMTGADLMAKDLFTHVLEGS